MVLTRIVSRVLLLSMLSTALESTLHAKDTLCDTISLSYLLRSHLQFTSVEMPSFSLQKKGLGVYSYYIADHDDGRRILMFTFLVLGARHKALRDEVFTKYGRLRIRSEAAGEVEIVNGSLVPRVNVTSGTFNKSVIVSDEALIRSVFQNPIPALGLSPDPNFAFIPFEKGHEHLHPLHTSEFLDRDETLGHFILDVFNGAFATVGAFDYGGYVERSDFVAKILTSLYEKRAHIARYVQLVQEADGAKIAFWPGVEEVLHKVVVGKMLLAEHEYSFLQRALDDLNRITSASFNAYDPTVSREEMDRRRVLIELPPSR